MMQLEKTLLVYSMNCRGGSSLLPYFISSLSIADVFSLHVLCAMCAVNIEHGWKTDLKNLVLGFLGF